MLMNNEAKYELKHLKRWKAMKYLLEETKEQLYSTTKSINFDSSNLPGGNHASIHYKMQKEIEEREKYKEIIDCYTFYIDRLENAINTLLTKEQKQACLIYANHPFDSKKRVSVAYKEGFSRSYYYKLIDTACVLLNAVLDPIVENEFLKTVDFLWTKNA